MFIARASAMAIATLIFASAASAQVQRTFVASFGNDANTNDNCSFINPCRSFTTALSKTIAGGEIVALDAAGYGAVTINQSVSISGNPGFYAGIAANTGTAVTITAGDVLLRGLNINSVGAAKGIDMTGGSSLTIDNCVITNFPTAGVNVDGAFKVRVTDSTFRGSQNGIVVQNGATLLVARSKFTGHNTFGVWVQGFPDGTTTVATVTDSISSGNVAAGFAVSAGGTAIGRLAVSRSTASDNDSSGIITSGPNAQAFVSYSVITQNVIGLNNSSGLLESQGNNTVRQNGTNTAGVITTISGT